MGLVACSFLTSINHRGHTTFILVYQCNYWGASKISAGLAACERRMGIGDIRVKCVTWERDLQKYKRRLHLVD